MWISPNVNIVLLLFATQITLNFFIEKAPLKKLQKNRNVNHALNPMTVSFTNWDVFGGRLDDEKKFDVKRV